jgi:hypothetical protein
MSSTLLEFPYRLASAHHRVPPDGAVARIIPFPRAPDCLTDRCLDAIRDLSCRAFGEWRCEAERDRHGGISVVIVSGGADGATYLICRSDRKLLLIEAQRSADWCIRGTFEDDADLLPALETKMFAPRPQLSHPETGR